MKFPKFEDIILFEDNDIIIVNKPPFLASLDEREGGEINLLRLAKQSKWRFSPSSSMN